MPVEDVILSLRSMISFEAPLSMEYVEMKDSMDIEGYSWAREEEMILAYNSLKKEVKNKFHSDLLEFYVNIWAYLNDYRTSGELWDRFGDVKERQLVEIAMDHQEILSIRSFRMSALKEVKEIDGRDGEIARNHISLLEKLPMGSMAIYFVDHPCTEEHGFPFDHCFLHDDERPKFGRRVA